MVVAGVVEEIGQGGGVTTLGDRVVLAADKAGNTNLLTGDSPILAGAGFQVSHGSGCDSTPPTLDSFQLTPTLVSNEAATEILVTATVSDVGSGAVTMAGWFEGPASEGGQVPKIYFSCSPDPDSVELST